MPMRRNAATPGLLPQPEDILEDCTLGGAKAVRQLQSIGSLEVGKKADLLVVNTQRAHLVPSGRIISTWIHNGQPSDIESSSLPGFFGSALRFSLSTRPIMGAAYRPP